MTVIEGSARLGGSGMRLVRFRGGALLVHLDDALHWLLRCATPELMLVNAPESVHGREIRRGAEALLEAQGITVTRHRAREVERVAARVSEARSALLRDADDAAGRLEGRGRAARFLLEHGSVAGMLEARFPTLVDVSASLRDVPGTGVVVTEAYRASVAAICRSLLVAELCMDRRVVPERLDDAYTRALGALEARSVGLQLSGDARMAVGGQR